ncbi:MAG: hypothetical protein OHK0013_00480 [Sandaracinaceae bacterium]
MSEPSRCDDCGAPHRAGLACCEYCDVPIPGRVLGVRCPSCFEVAVPEARSCPVCSQSFTKGCVFCGQVAFLTAPACPRCHEAFEGAEERKKARDEALRQQQMIGVAAQGVAVFGAAVATPTGRSVLGSLFDMIIRSNDGNLGKGGGYQGGSAKGFSQGLPKVGGLSEGGGHKK